MSENPKQTTIRSQIEFVLSDPWGSGDWKFGNCEALRVFPWKNSIPQCFYSFFQDLNLELARVWPDSHRSKAADWWDTELSHCRKQTSCKSGG